MGRELTTILAADVVGDSPVADESGTEIETASNFEETLADCIGRYQGRVADVSADIRLLAGFLNASDAVGCGVEIQRDLADRNEVVPATRQTRLRIGVNHETLPPDGEPWTGDDENSVARLVALAEPGGICISRSVYDEVRSRLKLPYDTNPDRKHAAFTCQEIRRKWDELNLLESSAVTIGPAALIGQPGDSSSAAVSHDVGSSLIDKLKFWRTRPRGQ
jgi:class 3 adenylate cyclase